MPANKAMTRIPVVGIGASAGGLESLQRFFRAVPSDSGLAYVVVQHLSPSFKSMMDSLLRRCTALPIDVIRDGMTLEANHVYLNPPARILQLTEGQFKLSAYPGDETLHLPIDAFFESLAASKGSRCAAVVLSGTGSDGAKGLRAVHDARGLVLAESRATAAFNGMPRSAVETGVVAAVLAPEEMPHALRAHLGESPASPTKFLEPIDEILRALRSRYDIDFNMYRRGTLTRRLERRCELSGADDMAAYAAQVVSDPAELQAALSDLLIGVTTFFRDPECFEALANRIRTGLNRLEELRIWSAGCATGQEAYSLAMLATELAEEMDTPIPIKVFATDVHASALEYATAGHYTEAEMEGVSQARRDRFFDRTADGYQVIPSLRHMVIFAQHDLLHDAPFTGIDVVVCRNLLIYLGEQGQERAISYMRFAMSHGGLLMLGPSEATQLGPTFEGINETMRIFVARARPATPSAPATMRIARPPVPSAQSQSPLLEAYDALCDRYMPPGFLIDDQRQLVDSFSGAERFLSITGRRPSSDFLNLLRTSDRGGLLSGLRRAEGGESVKLPSLELREGEDPVLVDLRIERIEGRGHRPHLLITLGEPLPYRPPEETVLARSTEGSTDLVADLERDLREARTQLQQTVEELEAANEELQASNEEMVASNEELQATNEELSSVNEELYSVNAEYQATNAKLHESNSALEQLFAATQVVTVFVDQALSIRRLVPTPNPVVAATDHDIGRKLTAFQHYLKWPEFYDAVGTVLENGEPLLKQVDAAEHDRTWFVQIHRYEVAPGAHGAVITSTDVTELVQAQRRAKRFQKRLTETTNGLPILLSYVNRDEVYEFVNDAYVRLWGKPRDEIVGSTVQEVLGPAYEAAKPAVTKALSGEKVEYAIELTAADGNRRFSLVSYTPAFDGDEVRGFYAAVTDITDRRETELALEIARAAADSATLAKSEFLANMSHEIRTPMTAILGYADLIAAETEEPKTAQHVQTIRRNGRHLIDVIDDVLDLSRIEHMGGDLQLVDVSPALLAADVHELFRLRAEREGLNLELDLGTRLPAQIRTHPQSVRQVLFNLMANAIKFTASGTVELRMRVEKRGERGAELVMSVRDTGIGFPDSMKDKLFQPFEQLDNSHTRTYKGTGLGLAISHRLAKALGGKLSAESVEGQGATFSLSLPLGTFEELELVEPDVRTPAVEAPQVAPVSGSVLVVDDADDVRLLVAEILERAGAKVTTASSGAESLSLLFDSGPFDAVVLDIQMPEMDGLAVARRMRANGFEAPILAVTARALPGDEAECIEAGCSGYLSKPVDAGQLTNRLGKLLAAPPVSRRKQKFLVVEDNIDAAETLVAMLEMREITASHVGTVADAIAAYEQTRPDVVLCDLGLPDGDGTMVARFVRDAGDQKTNLVALSGRHGGEVTARNAGFDTFVLKPVSLDELMDKLGTHG